MCRTGEPEDHHYEVIKIWQISWTTLLLS
jgi:hypothetical protein